MRYVIVTFEKQEQKQEPRQTFEKQPHDGNGNDNSWKILNRRASSIEQKGKPMRV